jgi:hypothetical protein
MLAGHLARVDSAATVIGPQQVPFPPDSPAALLQLPLDSYGVRRKIA